MIEITELPGLVTNKQITQDDGLVKLISDYHPLMGHVKHFCELTGDSNPAHKEHPVYHQALVPGFLQTTIVTRLIKESMKHAGINTANYPFANINIEMAGVKTGSDYNFMLVLDPETLKSSVRSIDKEKKRVYTLERKDFEGEQVIDYPNTPRVHSGRFIRKNSLEFGKLIGSESSESNLYALAASSFIICDAVKKGKLNAVPEELTVIYLSQKVHSDSSSSLNLVKGIDLELCMLDPEKFGKRSRKGDFLNTEIIARDHKGRFVYKINSQLSFRSVRLLDKILKP